MADLRHLLATYVHANQTGNSVPPHIDAEARATLAAEPPAPAEPDTDAVLALAAIIRQVDGSHSLGAAVLAEAILSHPKVASVFQPPAPAPADHVPDAGNMVAADGEREELAAWLDEEAKRCAAQFHDRITRAAALLREARPQPPQGGEVEA